MPNRARARKSNAKTGRPDRASAFAKAADVVAGVADPPKPEAKRPPPPPLAARDVHRAPAPAPLMPAVNIQQFTRKVQPRTNPAFHRLEIDLTQSHSAARNEFVFV